ncbi:MAG: TonB family protein [Chitinophaga sp.]|uniref:energy transducer TonB n=1 Tax=Chitinophaga sp. TaxID=1869181 RepID=UPI001B12C89D|nr:energy transducer TonB [Chitinophaga sp.]MBO9728076.1 TonB family protein [Chitinophaga sp.]
MDSTKIPGNEFLDILFDGRNKDYGAYELRSRYDKRVRNAIVGTASIVLVMIGGYVLNNTLMAADNVHRPVLVKPVAILDDIKIPDPDPVIPPPPPVQSAPPPVAATVAFVKPEIVAGEVPEESLPPKMNEIGNKAIGIENAEGPDDGVAAELSKGPGTGVIQVEAAPAADHAGPLTFVEMMPEFPGGEVALGKYLNKSIKYPHVAQENDIQGTVFIQFVVNRDGSITDVKTVGAAKGGGLEEEAKRVVSNMPKWKPGRQNGQNVAVFFNLPIRFVLGQ